MTEDNTPDSIHYGFMLQDELLHLQLVEVDWHPTHKKVYELAPLEKCDNTLGEWTTTDLMTVLSMRLMPADWCDMTGKGDSSEHPRPTYGEAYPMTVHTKKLANGTLQKLYIPLVIPSPMPTGFIACVNVGIQDHREVCNYIGNIVVGTIYYSLYQDTDPRKEPTFYECIAQIGSEYLILPLIEKELAAKLLGGC